MPASIEPIIGRYVNLDIKGQKHRLYVEEAGHGQPLLCLHTGGSDTRQYRHLMCDERLTSTYRVIAFDLPYHGKSLPPDGWHTHTYQLSVDDYCTFIISVIEALELGKPILFGCSIGGRIILHLAISHPDYFYAFIGAACAAQQTPWYDTEWLQRPDLDCGEVCAGIVSGLMAPQSPEVRRWETLWPYMQSGPGVFKGDIYFYREANNLASEIKRINTDTTPLYLMSGGYDFSCTPDDMKRTADAIAGAKLVSMPSLGHFPMTENPELFLGYLHNILDDLKLQRR
jgi:pimeloyl-ACP methyl ester carboxylesterase